MSTKRKEQEFHNTLNDIIVRGWAKESLDFENEIGVVVWWFIVLGSIVNMELQDQSSGILDNR